MAQSVKRPTSAQVMISQPVSSSPALGSVLTAQSLEPALDSVSPPLSASPPAHTLSLSLSKIKHKRGACVAQSVGRRTSAQVMISQPVSSSPASGSVLTTQSLEPVDRKSTRLNSSH